MSRLSETSSRALGSARRLRSLSIAVTLQSRTEKLLVKHANYLAIAFLIEYLTWFTYSVAQEKSSFIENLTKYTQAGGMQRWNGRNGRF